MSLIAFVSASTEIPHMRQRLVSAVFGLAAALSLPGCVATFVDDTLNGVIVDTSASDPTEATSDLHQSLFIVDLHADSMLWNRDFLSRSDIGHVDLPRLIEGNVALQVIGIVTKTPLKGPPPPGARLNAEALAAKRPSCISHDAPNLTALLQVLHMRPIATWFDLERRAFHQADRLKAFVAESQRRRAADPAEPVLMLIEDADDLAELVVRRATDKRIVGVMLALEGAHWIDGNPGEVAAGVARLDAHGFRMVAPTHRFGNALGAASEGCDQLAGLTEAGAAFLHEAHDRGMILDTAHASDLAIAEAARAVDGPLVVSHTGLRFDCPAGGRCAPERNIRREELQAIARTGGVVAVGFWLEAVGEGGVGRIGSAFRSAAEALAEPEFAAEMVARHGRYDPFEHIALGSDFDGAVKVPFDASNLAVLVGELSRTSPEGRAGFDERAIRLIAGVNACRVFALRLPGGGPERAREICGPLLQPKTP